MDLLDKVWMQLLSYGPLGLFLVLTIGAIIYLDRQRTSSAIIRAKEWQEERMFYQNHFTTTFAQIASLLEKHEERAQERHEVSTNNQHITALLLERLLERTEKK